MTQRVKPLSELPEDVRNDKSLRTERRDQLRQIEAEIQAKWEKERIFEVDAKNSKGKGKFMCTFPYPYMNGRIHIGHFFTALKADFAAGFQRLQGKDVLFPFAFHCTGMPIQAAANKLKREIEDFGIDKCVSGEFDGGAKAAAKAEKAKAGLTMEQKLAAAGTGPKGKKTKLAAKQGKTVWQWQILQKNGLSNEEIPKFVDAEYWLKYFPPLGMADLKRAGTTVDWRRSFITTSTNPYYDSFIRWQFRVLKESGKIAFGRRPTIYSIRDGQACADHARASGEGVNPQAYTLIKLRLLDAEKISQLKNSSMTSEEAKKVFLVAATLRPETMYGQTNCFVLPDGDYAVYRTCKSELFVCSKKSALNMSYQDVIEPRGEPEKALVTELKGWDLLGCAVNPPMSPYDRVYCLPLLTISMNKGTGVVTSVPSDAPDDYAALRDLQQDEELRSKYKITLEMVEPFEVVPIITIPGGCPALGIDDFGECAAVTCCEVLGVKNQHDKKKLHDAKDACYLRGFNFGIMQIGSQKGKPVKEAKDLVKNEMLANGTACKYYEPADQVISRSGDECVVAMLQQWYLKYGEESWRDAVLDHVCCKTPSNYVNQQGTKGFTAYNDAAHNQYEKTLGWLGDWACSRNFGLGTRVPWDEQFVIESLSDSTIYMAYYTVAHLLQGRDNADGSKVGPSGIEASQLTDADWDYIFRGKEHSDLNGVDEATLSDLRQEFEFWYPLDLRVSGKDLIRNHLTMALYNHAAVWPGQAETRWPQSYFTNGHVMVDNTKMAKSLGNFITLKNAIDSDNCWLSDDNKWQPQSWSADVLRFALAGAGDGLEDANFSSEVANQTILNLTKELEFLKEFLGPDAKQGGRGYLLQGGVGGNAEPRGCLRENCQELTLMDKVFLARMNVCIEQAKENYENMQYMAALKAAYHDLRNARDEYRSYHYLGVEPMNREILVRYFEVHCVLLAPICPHYCDYVWRAEDLLNHENSVLHADWPEITTVSDERGVLAAWDYIQKSLSSWRTILNPKKKKKKKKGSNEPPPAPATKGILYTKSTMEEWRCELISCLSSHWNEEKNDFDCSKKDLMGALRQAAQQSDVLKGKNKVLMKTAAHVINQGKKEGASAFETKLKFDEYTILTKTKQYIAKALLLEEISVFRCEDGEGPDVERARQIAEMGKPAFFPK
eukprot:g5238.t1